MISTKNRDVFNIEVGARIREARERSGLSRESLAEAAAISPQFLAELEIGAKGASAKTIYNLCKGLAVTPNFLLLGQNNENIDIEFVTEALISLSDEERIIARKIMSLLVQMLKAF